MSPTIGDQEHAGFTIPEFKDDVTSQEAISLLEAEVRKHENHIAALKTRMNSFAPISRLPAELICKIFEVVRQSYALREGSLRWIELSHVCHAWRNLMVHSPSFLTVLPMDSPLWTKEMILRSKDASLTVLIDLASFSNVAPVVSTAIPTLRLMPRIQELKITGAFRCADDLQRLLDSLPESAPALETLSLGCENYLTDWPQSARPREIILHTRSLRSMERLRSLKATSCRIDWETHLANMPMLTRLTINNIITSSAPTTTAFWNALKNMGALQHLQLSKSLPIAGDAPYSNNKVHLPNLKYLNLRGEPDQIARFLDGVVLPADVLLDIMCEGTDTRSSVNALRALSATIKSEIGSLTARQPVINGYQIEADYTHQRPRQAEQFARNYPEYGSLESDLRVLVTVQHPGLDIGPVPLDDLWTSLFHELPFSKVSNTTLYLEAALPPVILATTLGTLPKLESLVIEDRFATNIVKALQQDPPVFPVLSRLKLSSASFRSIDSWDVPSCTYDVLLECLTTRRKRELPIRHLTLSGYFPDMTDEKTATLREVVDEVESILNTFPEPYDDFEDDYEDEDEYDSYESDPYHDGGSMYSYSDS
ncbi:hypothetical protein CPC08DRAFT_675855 [Agrocybe pediades]|nr:hypothetical protein CPC08DRAFT_675855 [Agrocybe pediades]